MNRITQLTPRGALIGLHIGALMFGLSGIFGKLIAEAEAQEARHGE